MHAKRPTIVFAIHLAALALAAPGCVDLGEDDDSEDETASAALSFAANTCAVLYGQEAYFGSRQLVTVGAADSALVRLPYSVAVNPDCTLRYKYYRTTIDFIGVTQSFTTSQPTTHLSTFPRPLFYSGSVGCSCNGDAAKSTPQVATLSGLVTTGYVPLWHYAPVDLGTGGPYLSQVTYASDREAITLIHDAHHPPGDHPSLVVSGTTKTPATVSRAIRTKFSHEVSVVALPTGDAATSTCPK